MQHTKDFDEDALYKSMFYITFHYQLANIFSSIVSHVVSQKQLGRYPIIFFFFFFLGIMVSLDFNGLQLDNSLT